MVKNIVDNQLAVAKNVMAHCVAAKGRTGTFVAACLI